MAKAVRAPQQADQPDRSEHPQQTVESEYLSETGQAALFARLSRVALLLEDFHARCIGPFGLRFIDYSVLRVLQLAGTPYQLSPTRLSEVLVRSTGGMTQILDRLERDQLVQRSPDPSDRRKIIVGLTPAGLRLAKRANKVYVARKAKLLDQLSTAELDQVDRAVLRLLHLFADDFERQAAPAD